MSEADTNENHPLRLLEREGGLAESGMSLLLARSGVGKSAALINFALDLLLQGKQVLHFSVGMASEKTHQYYHKIYNDFIKDYPANERKSWDDVYHNFTVVSYMEAGNLIADLDTEIQTVVCSAKMDPALILIDGLEINDQTNGTLQAINRAAATNKRRILASMCIHRGADGHIDLDRPLKLASSHSQHIYYLEPEPALDRIKVDKVSESGELTALPLYFCPHNFVFRHR